MGCDFDDVTCEYPLSKHCKLPQHFQTTSLRRTMESYKITKDGRLLVRTCDYKQIPKKKIPKCGFPFLEAKNVKWEDTEFHGDMFIYGNTSYIIRFTEGKLTWTKKV